MVFFLSYKLRVIFFFFKIICNFILMRAFLFKIILRYYEHGKANKKIAIIKGLFPI